MDGSVALFTSSAAAMRAYFRREAEPDIPRWRWRDQDVVRDRQKARCTRPEIVRVRCGHKLHRLRLVAGGGPVVLLDHPPMDRMAELAMAALGARLPICLLVLDAIAGRVNHHRILWRRRPHAIATQAFVRRSRRRPGATPPLELPVAERYAAFVQHRASLLLSRLLAARTEFDVRVVHPRGLRGSIRSSDVWSWRQRPGFSPPARYRLPTVHVPFDWQVSVEQENATALQSSFVIEARSDRRGEMLHWLHCEVKKAHYVDYIDWTARIEAVDSANPVTARRWQRARGACRVTLPDTSSGGQNP
jgi:hypothetical protein